MHWVLIVAVLLAMTLAEKAPREAIEDSAWRAALAMLAMLVAPLLAATMSAVVIHGLRRNAHSWASWMARFGFGQQLHAAVLVALVGTVSYGLAWPQLVRGNLGLEGWILVDDLLLLAPVYVPLMLSWAVFYDVDRAVHELTSEEPTADDALSRWQYVALHARHYLGLVIVPLLIVLGIYDLVRWGAPDFLAGPHGWLLSVPLLALAIVAMPQLLTWLWKTTSLPSSELRSELLAQIQASGVHVRDVLVWQTGGRMTNAAVSGLVPGLRYVYVTDQLLETLNDDEIAAVVRHEAGHVVHHHLLLRLLLVGLPLAAWIAAAPWLTVSLAATTEWFAQYGIAQESLELVLPPLGMSLYGWIVLGGYCKQLEFEADLHASGPSNENAEPLMRALLKITAQGGGDVRRNGWLHPSIARRIRFLQRAQADPLLATEFRSRMRRLAWLMAAGYLVSLFAIFLSV